MMTIDIVGTTASEEAYLVTLLLAAFSWINRVAGSCTDIR